MHINCIFLVTYLHKLGSRSPLTSLWPQLRCDVGAGVRGRVAELCLCIVHCNVYCCIVMLHSSTSSFNSSRLIWLFRSLLVWLSSSKCLCNFFLFVALYILKSFITFFFSEPIFSRLIFYVSSDLIVHQCWLCYVCSPWYRPEMTCCVAG